MSSKDTFEAKTFAANTFACGTFRGTGLTGPTITGRWEEVAEITVDPFSTPEIDVIA
jgi:hypothetical protein